MRAKHQPCYNKIHAINDRRLYYKKVAVYIESQCIFVSANLMMFSYSLFLPFVSRHFLKATEASTFAGDDVLGSFNRDMILRRIVRTFCVGFQRSDGNSPLCGSSTGGCKIDIQTSPFYKNTRIDKSQSDVRKSLPTRN